MRNRIISFALILTIIALGISCQGGRHRTENSVQEISQTQDKTSQELQRPLGKGRGQQKRQAVGQGSAKRGANRNAKRAWGPDTVVELSAEEESAVDIETVEASYKSLRSQLQASGKVFAHPQKKAIVSYPFSARIAEIHIVLGDWVNAGKKLVIIKVKDSGPGIDPADLPHIFEPFVTTKNEGYGVGLGLSTVYGIMERHNGSIDVESRPGEGATFSLKLPVA